MISIQSQIDRFKWLYKNYRKINSQTTIAPTHYLGPITYNCDSLTTSNNCDFLTEPRFVKAYQAAKATKPWDGFTLQWRTYIFCYFANLAKHLQGDYVECGVNTGAYSIAAINYINFENYNKTYYLFDTFGGLNTNQITEAEYKAGIGEYLGNYHDVYEDVKATFKNYNVKVVKGLVPDTLTECKATSICFLSIDMNVTAPEIAAINYFWNSIVSGGIIVLDDYGFPPHINQKYAFDEFAKQKNVDILSLPTGQGIIFKP